MKFDTHAVLSTVTGRLMGDIDGVYAVTSFLIGRNAYTHDLAFYHLRAAAALKSAMPELPTKEDFAHVNGENYRAVLVEWQKKLGYTVEVPDHLRDCLVDERDPVSTLQEMAPGKPLIAISS